MLAEQLSRRHRSTEGSPSDTKVTEAFGVVARADALNMDRFDNELSPTAAAEEPPQPPTADLAANQRAIAASGRRPSSSACSVTPRTHKDRVSVRLASLQQPTPRQSLRGA